MQRMKCKGSAQINAITSQPKPVGEPQNPYVSPEATAHSFFVFLGRVWGDHPRKPHKNAQNPHKKATAAGGKWVMGKKKDLSWHCAIFARRYHLTIVAAAA
ncbi:MAG: hypothetical protein VKK99_07685, partial [Cyanobacteriota bacterium]|nr:hypothetical protein [Cyanobacteriota bacterium]